MSDLKQRISDLAGLMEEFHLSEAEFESDGERIAFRRRIDRPVHQTQSAEEGVTHEEHVFPVEPEPIPAEPLGIAVTSPMTGIYYGAPSPNAPPFVREGVHVTAGQVVGLIEAMKVFNEITASTSGRVLKIVAEGGQLVQPGDPLLYVG
ncbi:MAG: acetyl-CoA carboxylase biotin carboxyl carrier protein [Fimbriimonadales bacterium]